MNCAVLVHHLIQEYDLHEARGYRLVWVDTNPFHLLSKIVNLRNIFFQHVSNIEGSEVSILKDQHHFILGTNHALYVYSIQGNKYNGDILQFPDYTGGSEIRVGKHSCDIPTQASVEEAKVWAKNYLGL
jgi:hypothetical protein